MKILKVLLLILSLTSLSHICYAQSFENTDSVIYKELLNNFTIGNNQKRVKSIKSFVVNDKLENLSVKTQSIDWFGIYENIIIEKKGKTDSIVYITCHYDKIDGNILYLINTFFNGIFDIGLSNVTLSKGAYDNGSGVIISLMLLRWINNIDTKYTYRFIFTGMEEYGLRGSRRYVSSLKLNDWEKSVYAVNIDMVGHKSSENIVVTENVSDSILVSMVDSICTYNNYNLTKTTLPSGALGDYRSFSGQSFVKDFSTSLMINTFGAFVPQKSYFTKKKKAIPVINFTDKFKLTGSEYLSIFSPISFGKIHSFRDNQKIVEINNLNLYTIVLQKIIVSLEKK